MWASMNLNFRRAYVTLLLWEKDTTNSCYRFSFFHVIHEGTAFNILGFTERPFRMVLFAGNELFSY